MNAEESAPIVIDLVKALVAHARTTRPDWTHAYFRVQKEQNWLGSNGSLVTRAKVHLLDPFGAEDFYECMKAAAARLFASMDKERGLFVLEVDSSLDYEIHFEWTDLNRWKITKLDGAKGTPAGLESDS